MADQSERKMSIRECSQGSEIERNPGASLGRPNRPW